MRRVAWIAAAVFGVLAGGLLLWQFRAIVFLFAGALVLAATLFPLGETVKRWGMPRAVAVLTNLLVTVLGLLLFLGISGYVLADNLPRLLVDSQLTYAGARSALLEGSRWQQTVGRQLPESEGFEDLLARLQESAGAASEAETAASVVADPLGAAADPNAPAPANADAVGEAATPAEANGAAPATAADSASESSRRATGLLRIIVGTTSSVAGWLAQFIILIFVALYWSLERDTVERLWLSLVPAANRQRVRTTWRKVEEDLGHSVRSELLKTIMLLVLLWLGFSVMGLDYPLLAAWVGALLWLIPLVGWLMATPLIALVGLLEGPGMAAAATAYTLVAFGLLGFIVEPRLDVRQRAGSVTGLVVALVLFESLGLLGLLVATPLAVALHTLVRQATAPQRTQTEAQLATGQVATAQAAGLVVPVVIPEHAVTMPVGGAGSVVAPVRLTPTSPAVAPSAAAASGPAASAQAASAPATVRAPVASMAGSAPVVALSAVAANPTAAAAGIQALRERLNAVRDQMDPESSAISERTRSLYATLQRLLNEAEETLPSA